MKNVKTEDFPFILLRLYGNGKENQDFIESVFQACRKHPGLIEELWFAGASPLLTDEALKQTVDETLVFRDACQKHGIALSYQQGVTLNHAEDKVRYDSVPEDAWLVDGTGRRCNGLYCPTSQFAKARNLYTAEYVLRTLQPASYWPDDDLRLSIKPEYSCCCDRCMKLFNERFHHDFTREQLVTELKEGNAVIRKEWILSNAQNLSGFAALFRKAVDSAAPECRLGLQLPNASEMYNGPDYSANLKAVSGPEKRKVGIRPGGGFYEDREPRTMLDKSLDMQLEALRSAGYGFVDQICYEDENWPHIGAEKNPYLQMNECALMLASGCNSLALYWGTDSNAEKPEFYAFYFDAVAKFKPYFRKIRDSFAGTTIAGMALYHGENYFATPFWRNKRSQTEVRLMENALPVTCMEGTPEMFVLNERCVDELAPEDFEICFSRPVLMDIPSFRKLAEKFPQLTFTKSVSFCNDSNVNLFDTGKQLAEVFRDGKKALDYKAAIRPEKPEVQPFSSVESLPGTCGTCVIPTEFAGDIILVQSLESRYLWTAYRREAVLDAVDSVKPLSVRLMTGGFCISVTGHLDASGRTAGVFLMNMGCGETMPLQIALRNPAFRKYRLYCPGGEPEELHPLQTDETEILLDIPPLRALQSVLIAGE